MERLKTKLDSIKSEADSALSLGENFPPAQNELKGEFPYNRANIFRIFLDYGPHLCREVEMHDGGWPDDGAAPPAALGRFARVLILGYGYYSGEGPVEAEAELVIHEIADLFKTIDDLWMRWESSEPDDFVGDKEYIQTAVKLRALLHELAEVEFLGEQNWSFWSYRSSSASDGQVYEFETTDHNPLCQNTTLPSFSIHFLYGEDAESEYNEFRGGYDHLPRVNECKGASVVVDGRRLAEDELQDFIIDITQRMVSVERFFGQMDNDELAEYYSMCHLLPLYHKFGIDWDEVRTDGRPPFDQLSDSIRNRTYSSDVGTSDSLYTMIYFEKLLEGINKIRADIQSI